MTMEWITVRPRVTTILARLISECAQAAELAEGSEWDAIRWRTSMLLYVAPSVLLSKPKKPKQNEGDGKDEIKESNQMKMMQELRRRLQLAEKGEWNRLLSSHTEDYPRSAKKARKEENKGEGSQRARDQQNATPRAQQGNIRGACQALVGRGLAPNGQDKVEKVKSMVAMDVTSDEHKELENARKEAKQSTRNDHWRGQKENSCSHIKAGAARGPSGLRNNHPSNCSVDSGLDQKEARTPRNESMERSTDSTT